MEEAERGSGLGFGSGEVIQICHLLILAGLKKGNAKECSNYCTVTLISHASKVMLKILQARLQQYVNHIQMFKLVLEKAEEPEIKLPTSAGSWKKQESSRKTSTSAPLTMLKPFGYVDHNKLWKILKDGNTRPPYLPSEKPICRSRSNC